LLVLDEQLKVISANRAFYLTFRVENKGTEGQIIYEIGNRQWNIPQLKEMLKPVIGKNSIFDGSG
jgi:hypothetical protein